MKKQTQRPRLLFYIMTSVCIFLFLGCPGEDAGDSSPAGTKNPGNAEDLSSGESPKEEKPAGPITPSREAEALSVPGLTYVSPVSRGNLTAGDNHGDVLLPEKPKTIFTYSAPAPAYFPGVLYDSRYYHADSGGTVAALSVPDGNLLWENIMESPPAGSPVILSDMLLAARTDGLLTAFSRESGEALWSADLGFPLTASPVYAGGVILTAGESGIAAVSPFDGEVLWQGSDPSLVSSVILKINEELVLLFGAPVLSALNPGAGEIIWQMETGSGDGITGAVLDSGYIYAKAGNQVELINTADEEQPAAIYTYADPDAPLRSDGTRLIVPMKAGGIISALPGSDGDSWEWYPPEPVSSNLLVLGDYLIAGSGDLTVYFILKESGEIAARWDTDYIPRALSYGNGILVAADAAGNVTGYGIESTPQ